MQHHLAKTLLASALCALSMSSAFGAAVSCSSSNSAQLRVLTIDPALVGGLCYTQLGNFTPAQAVDIVDAYTGAKDAVHLDKDEASDAAGPNEAWLTGFNNGTSGTWTVSADAWDAYDKLFLGFHFGEARGQGSAADPDSFIVELSRADTSGTWSLGGTGAFLNGLSHIDLIGSGTGGGGPQQVPEPGALALVGLALLAASRFSRRKA